MQRSLSGNRSPLDGTAMHSNGTSAVISWKTSKEKCGKFKRLLKMCGTLVHVCVNVLFPREFLRVIPVTFGTTSKYGQLLLWTRWGQPERWCNFLQLFSRDHYFRLYLHSVNLLPTNLEKFWSTSKRLITVPDVL